MRRKHSGSRGERHGKGRTSGRTESGIMMTKSGIMMTIERGNDDESGIIRTKSGMIGVSGGIRVKVRVRGVLLLSIFDVGPFYCAIR